MKKTKFLAAVSAVAIMLTGCGGSATLKKTAMEIGDVKITAGDVAVMADLVSQGNFDATKASALSELENSFKYAALAESMGIELTAEEKADVIKVRAQQAANKGGLKMFERYLSNNASSVEFIDSYIQASYLQSKVATKVNEEIGGEEVTDEVLKDYYNSKYLRAKHILIEKPVDGETPEKDPKKLAEELLERAKNGEDFDAMIKEYSTDPGSETNPDGYVFTDGEMVKPFEDGVKALKSGEFGICESDYGYHVLLRLDLPEFTEETKTTVSPVYSRNRVTLKIDDMLKEKGIEVVIHNNVIDAISEDMIKKTEVEDATTQVQY